MDMSLKDAVFAQPDVMRALPTLMPASGISQRLNSPAQSVYSQGGRLKGKKPRRFVCQKLVATPLTGSASPKVRKRN